MRHYRLYCLEATGSISLAEWIEALDDADALRQARDLKPGALKCEIWCGKRPVATIDGQAASA